MKELLLFLKKSLAGICAFIILLICGCDTHMRSSRKTEVSAINSELKICCNEYYYHAFERVIRAFNLKYPDLKVSFTESRTDADILITDRIDSANVSNFAPLDNMTDIADFIPELLFKSGDSTIGLPLFLKIDGIWLDRLPYLRENIDIPYRFGDTVNSEFIKSNPILFGADRSTLYWGIIAPLYISYGGSADDISLGELSGVALTKSLEKVRNLIENGILKFSENPSSSFASGQTAGWLCSFLDIIKIQQDMPLSSKLVFSPGITVSEGESINIIIRADTLFVRKSADETAVKLFVSQLFEENNVLKLISDTHLPSAIKVNCKNHSLPEILRKFYSVLSSTAVKTVYVTDTRSDSKEAFLNGIITDICKS